MPHSEVLRQQLSAMLAIVRTHARAKEKELFEEELKIPSDYQQLAVLFASILAAEAALSQRPDWSPGEHVILREAVNPFQLGYIPAGATGTVVGRLPEQDGTIQVRMHAPFKFLEEEHNILQVNDEGEVTTALFDPL